MSARVPPIIPGSYRGVGENACSNAAGFARKSVEIGIQTARGSAGRTKKAIVMTIGMTEANPSQ